MTQHTACHSAVAIGESRTEYSWTARVAPGASRHETRATGYRGRRGCGSGKRPGSRRTARRRRSFRGPRCGCGRSAPTRAMTWPRLGEHAARRVDRDDLRLGATASRAAVDAPVPQPASSNRSPRPSPGVAIVVPKVEGGHGIPGWCPRVYRRPCAPASNAAGTSARVRPVSPTLTLSLP